jgi:hypothetical protein
MSNSTEMDKRISFLKKELENAIRHAGIRARIDHWLSIILMLSSLVASAYAGIGGLTEHLTRQQTAAIALLPGSLVLIATILNFEGKSDWHYRKMQRMDDLRDQLMLQLPESPNVDQIAQLSKKKNKCVHEMHEEWVSRFSLNWSKVPSGRPPNDSTNS